MIKINKTPSFNKTVANLIIYCDEDIFCITVSYKLCWFWSDNAYVYTLVGLPINKEMVYTPIGCSPTINVLVYAHFGFSPKIKF